MREVEAISEREATVQVLTTDFICHRFRATDMLRKAMALILNQSLLPTHHH